MMSTIWTSLPSSDTSVTQWTFHTDTVLRAPSLDRLRTVDDHPLVAWIAVATRWN